MKTLAVLVALLVSSRALAEDVAILLPNVAKSYTVTTDGRGGAVIVPLAGVVRPGTTPGTPPTTPPSTLTPFEQEVKAQTQTVLGNEGGTKTTGAALSEVYSRVSAGVADGSIPPEQALGAIRAATNLVLVEMPDKGSWGGWRTAIGDALTKLQQEGALASKAQMASALRQISNGLNAATGYTPQIQSAVQKGDAAKGILDGINIEKIIELIKLIMELLKLFGG